MASCTSRWNFCAGGLRRLKREASIVKREASDEFKAQIGTDCGMEIESRITSHEPRKTSVAEQSHFVGNARPRRNWGGSVKSEERSTKDEVRKKKEQGTGNRELRNADFGLTSASSVESRNGDQEKQLRFDKLDSTELVAGTAGESRTTSHRPRKTSVAEQSHFVGNTRPRMDSGGSREERSTKDEVRKKRERGTGKRKEERGDGEVRRTKYERRAIGEQGIGKREQGNAECGFRNADSTLRARNASDRS